MIELCFDHSAKGALRFAQHCGRGGRGVIGVVVANREGAEASSEEVEAQKRELIRRAKERQKELEKEAVALGGTGRDVLGLLFGLNKGDIAAEIVAGDCPRRQLLRDWLTADPWGELKGTEDSVDEEWVDEEWRERLGDMRALRERAGAGEAVRIWADSTPHSACGLLFAASLLSGLPCEVTLVRCPAAFQRGDGCVVEPRGWGELEPELFGRFVGEARVLSEGELREMAEAWQRLREENAPLRAVVEGRVVSVGADYYDAVVLEELGEQTLAVAAVIGRVLGRRKVGVGDWLIAQRIRALIAAGEIVLVREEQGRFYASEIRRRTAV